jgi:hypothetical protein
LDEIEALDDFPPQQQEIIPMQVPVVAPNEIPKKKIKVIKKIKVNENQPSEYVGLDEIPAIGTVEAI